MKMTQRNLRYIMNWPEAFVLLGSVLAVGWLLVTIIKEDK